MATLAADFAPVRRSDWTLPVAAYGAYALVCILAFHSTALQMAATWFSSSSYHHGAAVPLLAALMIVERPRFDPSTFSPALLAVIAACLAANDRAYGCLAAQRIRHSGGDGRRPDRNAGGAV